MKSARHFKSGYQRTLAVLLTFASSLGALPAAADQATAEPRVSVVTQIAQGGRDGAKSSAVRREYTGLATNGSRATRQGMGASAKLGADDFWFYEADVVLFGDDDNDGYFFGLDLLFDVDTVYEAVDVYAVAYLSLEGGPWNEYASTDDFVISGATGDDEYVIVTELESGYPAADYDLLIELYDAIDGAFLASFGPGDSSALSFLPLEDFQRDTPIVDNIVVVGGGGGNGFGLLLLIAIPAFRLMHRLALAKRGPAA